MTLCKLCKEAPKIERQKVWRFLIFQILYQIG